MKSLSVFLVAVVAIVVIGLVVSLPVMWLWNVALVPAIPALMEISWMQAWGILILSGFLFKSNLIKDEK
jgi:hypothetical protein